MKLSEWAHIAEITSAIAVVVSLIYIGLEVNQNTAAVTANTRQSMIDYGREQSEILVTNETLSNLFDNSLLTANVGLNPDASPETRSIASAAVNTLGKWPSNRVATEEDRSWRTLTVDSLLLIDRLRDNPEVLAQLPPTPVPPGSPTGAGDM